MTPAAPRICTISTASQQCVQAIRTKRYACLINGDTEIFLALVTETQGNKSITQTSSSRSFFYHPLSLCHTGTHPSSPKTYSLSLFKHCANNYLHPASFLKNFQMICLPFFCQTISFTSHFCLPLLFTHHIAPLLLSCSLSERFPQAATALSVLLQHIPLLPVLFQLVCLFSKACPTFICFQPPFTFTYLCIIFWYFTSIFMLSNKNLQILSLIHQALITSWLTLFKKPWNSFLNFLTWCSFTFQTSLLLPHLILTQFFSLIIYVHPSFTSLHFLEMLLYTCWDFMTFLCPYLTVFGSFANKHRVQQRYAAHQCPT